MHILIVTEQWFPDYAGGSGRVATETALDLARRGHDVTVIAPTTEGLPSESRPVPGLRLLRVVPRSNLVPQTTTDPILFRRAVRRLRTRFDIAIAHQPSGVFAARAARAPIAFVFHASGYREAVHRRSTGLSAADAVRSFGVEQPLKVLERRAANEASVILVLSEFSRSLLAADQPQALRKVEVAGGGIDTDRFTPATDRPELRERLGIPGDGRVLLTVRRLVARTGVGNLIDAMPVVHANDPAIKLVIVGDGEDRAALERRAAAGAAPDSIRFLGRVSDDEVVDWYRAADLFVLPTIAYEGFGMSTAEALACGTPVVGTPVGATHELLDRTAAGYVSESAEPSDLGAAINEALGHLSDDLRGQARAYAVDQLSVAAMVQRWLDTFAGCEVRETA